MLPGPMIDWTHWHNEPFLVGGLILLGWLYAVLTGPLRSKLSAISHQPSAAGAGPRQASEFRPRVSDPAPYPRGHAVKFYSALVIFYLAVGSPLDQAGERFLLSAHMFQHQLLTFPAAILFLLGLPDWLVRPITGRPGIRGLLRFLTHPLICGLVYTTTMTGWHAPWLYDAALQDRTLHIVEHFMFFGAALFLWWPVCSPSREFPPAPFAVQMFYYVGVTIGMTPVFAYITFSGDVLYPTYEFAPRITALTAHQDQVLAGTMMKLVSMTVMMGAFGVSFYRWYQESEVKPGQA